MKVRTVGLCLALLGLFAWITPMVQAAPREHAPIVVGSFSVSVPAAPAPTGSCAGSAIHCVMLTYVAPTKRIDGTAITGALTYTVSRALVSGGPYTQLASGIAGTSYEDDTVTSSTTYFYVVQASEAGNSAGPSSNSNQVTAVEPGVAPNPPTGATATAF